MSRFLTLGQETSAEFVERRSRFIGYCKPVQREDEAVDFIAQIRAKHWNATHNVYAYVLREGQTRRYSDDGEPQGTAGIPVLEVLTKTGITDAAIVVTRYFGGVMLGAGGLVRAYSHGAKLAVDAGGVIEMGLCHNLRILCDYTQYGRIAALIPEEDGVTDDTHFTDRVEILFHMPAERIANFAVKLTDLSAGRVCAEKTGENYYQLNKL